MTRALAALSIPVQPCNPPALVFTWPALLEKK
jgi:hypothetical protein